MRSGRSVDGSDVNQGLVHFLANSVLESMFTRALKNAMFFTRVTGRAEITGQDIVIGLIDAAYRCTTDDMVQEQTREMSDAASLDSSSSSEHFSEEDGSDDEMTSTEEEDDDEEVSEDFTTAVQADITDGARLRAKRMKTRMYSWHAFQPRDELQNASRKAIDKLISHPPLNAYFEPCVRS